ncbi:TPA: glucosaminidase domain-containing protein, partial [Aeromonas hydrophila subsp. hydrophila]|nr:glucosaminidase domain-containing protein [Aeromonas hydrophila subsp. hydrophila]HEB5046879.1 glucosaminidase domain-containing protein [Aeromonas hydrophila subsp. hydrophila]
MKFAFPILTATGEEFKDVKALTALINGEQSGHYLLGNHSKWHGGIHISDKSAPWCKDKYPVRAMADGKVVAFRMMKDYLTSEFQGESLRYSNCFCLVQHEYCEINAETKAKNEFTFYSLYMHLLPWDQYQRTERLVLKKGWNARNSVPDAEQQRVDTTLPRFTLPKDTELEMDSNTPPQKGSVGGKEYDFIKVTIKSQLSNTQMKEAEKAGVVVSQGSSVWIANSPTAVEVIKPNLPTWLFDQIEAELLTNMVGRADPGVDGPTGRLMVGDKSVSLPAGTKLQYDAHQLEFHWDGDKTLKMARCNYVTPDTEGAAGGSGMAWVCVEDKFIKAKTLPPSHLGELYVLPSPVAIAAGEIIGYLGLVETPGSLIGGKKSKYQVHLEVFTQDPRLDDVLANKAGTKGGATYAKVPAELVLYEKKKQDGKDLWVATADKSQEELVESPKLEKDTAKQEWLSVSSGKYVKKEQVELLSQHDWLKIGFKKVDGSGSDGYLDPDAPPTFFTELVKSFDTDKSGELSSEEIQAALQNSNNAEKLHKLIVKHPSEWYEKSSASSYLWLDKLMTKIGLPDFDILVDHEKQRIDKLEWMQSAAKLKLHPESWHFFPLIFREKKIASRLPKNFTRSEFVTFVYESAKESQAISRVPAEITAAQAILETGYGKSVPIDVNT